MSTANLRKPWPPPRCPERSDGPSPSRTALFLGDGRALRDVPRAGQHAGGRRVVEAHVEVDALELADRRVSSRQRERGAVDPGLVGRAPGPIDVLGALPGGRQGVSLRSGLIPPSPKDRPHGPTLGGSVGWAVSIAAEWASMGTSFQRMNWSIGGSTSRVRPVPRYTADLHRFRSFLGVRTCRLPLRGVTSTSSRLDMTDPSTSIDDHLVHRLNPFASATDVERDALEEALEHAPDAEGVLALMTGDLIPSSCSSPGSALRQTPLHPSDTAGPPGLENTSRTSFPSRRRSSANWSPLW